MLRDIVCRNSIVGIVTPPDSVVGIVTTPQAGRPWVRNPTREDVPLILKVQTGSEADRARYMGVGVASSG